MRSLLERIQHEAIKKIISSITKSCCGNHELMQFLGFQDPSASVWQSNQGGLAGIQHCWFRGDVEWNRAEPETVMGCLVPCPDNDSSYSSFLAVTQIFHCGLFLLHLLWRLRCFPSFIHEPHPVLRLSLTISRSILTWKISPAASCWLLSPSPLCCAPHSGLSWDPALTLWPDSPWVSFYCLLLPTAHSLIF